MWAKNQFHQDTRVKNVLASISVRDSYLSVFFFFKKEKYILYKKTLPAFSSKLLSAMWPDVSLVDYDYVRVKIQ